uniref:Uncharacterized protein n=1 Tax=Rhizophora mucronata TaxID=61149 RepID=A0A2P2IHH5_RHIMU
MNHSLNSSRAQNGVTCHSFQNPILKRKN